MPPPTGQMNAGAGGGGVGAGVGTGVGAGVGAGEGLGVGEGVGLGLAVGGGGGESNPAYLSSETHVGSARTGLIPAPPLVSASRTTPTAQTNRTITPTNRTHIPPRY